MSWTPTIKQRWIMVDILQNGPAAYGQADATIAILVREDIVQTKSVHGRRLNVSLTARGKAYAEALNTIPANRSVDA